MDNETLDTTMDQVDAAEMNSSPASPDYTILGVIQNATLTDLTEPSMSSRRFAKSHLLFVFVHLRK